MYETRHASVENANHYPSRELLRTFTVPPESWVAGNEGFLRPEAGIFPKPDVSLVVGRFQPVHWGHMYLIHKALEISNSVIIGIGSINILNSENPWTALQRHEMLNFALTEAGIRSKAKIVHLRDYHHDEKWLNNAQRVTGKVDIVLGNNPWVNDIYKAAGIETMEIPLFDRNEKSGKRCRQKLRDLGYLRNIPLAA